MKTFTAFIRDGRHSQETVESEIRKFFDGKNVDITYQLHKKKRSIKQNNSLFGIPYKMISEVLTDLWGENVSVEQTHEMMKQRFEHILFEYSIVPYEPKELISINGHKEYINPRLSTTNLSTVGMMKYYEALQQFGSMFLGIDIPSPNEKDFKEENRK